MNNEKIINQLDKLQYIIDMRSAEIENIRNILLERQLDSTFLFERIKMLEEQIIENNKTIVLLFREMNK